MCAVYGAVLNAIVGHAQADEVNYILNKLANRSIERGRDGRGWLLNSDGLFNAHLQINRVRYGELELPGSNYVFGGLGACSIIGNTRAEPTTEWVKEKQSFDQQPYYHRNWAIVHNGTIANDKELRTNRLRTKVDSAAVLEVLERSGNPVFAEFVQCIKELNGSYAILAVHKNFPGVMYVATNYRPIWTVQTEYGRFFASSESYFDDLTQQRPEMIEPYTAALYSPTRCVSKESLRKQGHTGALVVCSGGLDSVVAAAQTQHLGHKIAILHFDYGCRAKAQELKAVTAAAAALHAPLTVVPLPHYRPSDSPLLRPHAAIAGGIAGSEFAHEWVPARNLVMISIAVSIAEANDLSYVVLGNNLEEAGAYPDNEPEFINRLNSVMPFATSTKSSIQILQPVGNLMKHEIVALGLRLSAPMELTWSCYNNGEKHCGHCGPCFMRRTAFEINNAKDPVFEE